METNADRNYTKCSIIDVFGIPEINSTEHLCIAALMFRKSTVASLQLEYPPHMKTESHKVAFSCAVQVFAARTRV